MEFPQDRQYTESHEWVRMDGDQAEIGLSDHAQNEMGDIVFVDLPEVGDEVEAGESFADIESVKAVSEAISPVSGEVVAVNEDLLDDPSLINQDPNNAWLIRVEPATLGVEVMDADEYAKSIE
ncbi:MAG: glycine cleavage system protein GcvH [Eggerthellaceae bacterium]|jgi:glycine cleavage system H protein